MNRIKEVIAQNRSLVVFLGWGFFLLLLWVVFATFFHPQLMALHYYIIIPQTKISGWLLELIGYHAFVHFPPGQQVGRIVVEGVAGVLIGSGCSGLELFVIFAGFILLFRGKAKNKLWFLPLGLLLILVLNIIRISALALILYYAPEYMDFNHKYTFVIMVYGAIFLLWLWWVNKFADNKKENA